MKRLVKRLISDTVLEYPARKASDWLWRMNPPDEKDRLTLAVMQRTLTLEANCVDVGCHKGFFLRHMRSLAPRGRHLAFEPIPALFRQLEAEFADDERITLFSCALSDVSGDATFHLNQDNFAYSGLRRRRYPSEKDRVKVIGVPVRRLDDLVPDDVVTHFMKIDVEGAELPVLRGSDRILSACRPVIVFEFGLGASERYGSTPEGLHAFFADRDYGLFTLPAYMAGLAALARDDLVEEYATNRHYYFVAVPAAGRAFVTPRDA